MIAADLAKVILFCDAKELPACSSALVSVFEVIPQPNVAVLHMIEAMCHVCGDELSFNLPQLLPVVLSALACDREDIVRQSLVVVKRLGRHVEGWTHVIIPQLLTLLQSSSNSLVMRQEVLATLQYMAMEVSVSKRSVSMMAVLASIIETQGEPLLNMAIEMVTFLIMTLRENYINFGYHTLIGHILSSRRIQNVQYDTTLRALQQNDPFPTSFRFTPVGNEEKQEEAVLPGAGDGSGRVVDQDALKAAWRVSNALNAKEKDWSDWCLRVSTALIRESPAAAVRACARLAALHQVWVCVCVFVCMYCV